MLLSLVACKKEQAAPVLEIKRLLSFEVDGKQFALEGAGALENYPTTGSPDYDPTHENWELLKNDWATMYYRFAPDSAKWMQGRAAVLGLTLPLVPTQPVNGAFSLTNFAVKPQQLSNGGSRPYQMSSSTDRDLQHQRITSIEYHSYHDFSCWFIVKGEFKGMLTNGSDVRPLTNGRFEVYIPVLRK